MFKTFTRCCLLGVMAAGSWTSYAQSSFKSDPLVATSLPAKPSAHWVWVNDIVFHHMADGKAFLIDGDSGKMLGMLSTGFSYNGVVLPDDRSVIISPETYFSRGTRGTRTDVITLYDPRKLSPLGEIQIPPKRAGTLPMIQNSALTDDGRFLLIYNFTPAQSVTVVDMKSRKFVAEADTAGCAMVYPTGPRSFFSLCNDGTAVVIALDDVGKMSAKTRTARLFDPVKDPVTEKAVRLGAVWYFASFSGDVVPVETNGTSVKPARRWSLTSTAERAANWRPGGLQHLSVHKSSRRLYSLMHQGGPDSHKDPGNEVWVYDLNRQVRIQRIKLKDIATSIAVTSDASPLLFSIFIGAPRLDVYDAGTGKFLRAVSEIGFTPSTLVVQ